MDVASDSPETRTLPLLNKADKTRPRILPKTANYQLLVEIAHGGMGLVFRALDPSLERTLALVNGSSLCPEMPMM